MNYQQNNWTELLPFTEVAYNSMHSSTEFNPSSGTGVEFVPASFKFLSLTSLAEYSESHMTRSASSIRSSKGSARDRLMRAPQREVRIGDECTCP